ncbi:gliding motility-associated C-terminal domain-containing protein [Solitalea lacus]|uniref:T9SS type B sorting domain-containing protein n=1 Tax=Solitalea lacus TaxID=2911172 RepID=UPI001EDBE8C5|nr:gliding motility-associated C-terminal domain-containing protein [Solitalea lacus]UKJ06466.1 gliding motility-associated C-terminal domain-containing protein [Solitalea lacus]
MTAILFPQINLLKIMRLIVFCLIVTIWYLPRARAQTIDVHLENSPDASWTYSTSNRTSNFCNNDRDECIRFLLYLNPDVGGVSFNVFKGPSSVASASYKIDCGPAKPLGELSCVTPHVDGTPTEIVFCKPGNDVYDYVITTVKRPSIPKDLDIRVNCSAQLDFGAVASGTSLTINSTTGPTPGQYNSLIIPNPVTSRYATYTSVAGSPAVLTYSVTGTIKDGCGNLLPVTGSFKVNNYPALTAVITSDVPVLCGSASAVLTANAGGGKPSYSYQWKFNGNNISGATGSTYTTNTPGSYTVEVQDQITSCPSVVSSPPFVLTQSSKPTATISGGGVTICPGISTQLSIALSGTAPWSITYTDGTTPVTVNGINSSPYQFSVSPSSTKTYTIGNVSDSNCSNVGDGSALVTVGDITPPAALCKNITIQLGSNGTVSIAPADINNGSTDNCGSVTLSASKTSFDCSNIGPNNVTLTVTDAYGNSSTCVAVVTVEDKAAPTVICKNITVQLGANGIATITGVNIDNGSSDNCTAGGPLTYSLSKNTFDCSNIGPNDVTLTVTDSHGNSSTCSTVVTVEDKVAPTVICKNITVQLGANGTATITGVSIDNGSNDNCTAVGLLTFSVSKSTFDCSNIGQNKVILTVTDSHGNSSTCEAVVTVEDKVVPTVVCKNITVQLGANGTATITGVNIDNGSSDNCTAGGALTYSLSKNAFDCSNIGPNNVTLTVTDSHGNSSTCSTVVTVEDKVAPIAKCKNITIQLNATGSASITAADINNGSSDNCGIKSLTINKSNFDCSNVGPNAVTLTVTDNNNNVSTCEAVVTVVDNTAPTVRCKPITIQLDAAGQVSITAEDLNDGSFDNCGIQSMVISQTHFNSSNLGTIIVTLTVTDNHGNVSTCQASVTIVDEGAPVVKCKPLTVQLDANGQAHITTADIDNGSSDNDGIKSMTISKSVFDCSNVGENIVTLTVTDNSNNVSTCQAVVTVVDNIPPVAKCKPVTIPLDATGKASITAADINNGSFDNCGIKSLTVSKTDFDCSNVGANAVTLTVTDNNGNVSTCQTVVTVVDDTDPVVICKPITIQLDAASHVSITAEDLNNGSWDNCGIQSMVVSQTNFDHSNLGTITVTLTVTDNHGNVSTCQASVTVVDNIAPVVQCKPLTVQLDANGQAVITAADIDNGSSDNDGIKSWTISKSVFDCSNIGENTVTLTITDNSNNVSICQATVTVVDNTAPVVKCKPLTISLDANGKASITVADIDNGSFDNCGIKSMELSQTQFDCSNVGENPVTLTVTDNNGNVSTCQTVVTVVDDTAPVVICKPITIQLDESGKVSISAADINDGSWDNCGIQSMVVSQTNFDSSNLGTITVTLTVTDNHGNVSTCQSVLTVEDKIKPIKPSLPDLNGECSVTATAPTTSDNYNNATITGTTSDPLAYTAQGTYIITWTFDDGNGNVQTATQNVIVKDVTLPQITPPADITSQGLNTGSAINLGTPVTSDNCGVASVINNAPAVFPEGTTTVIWTVTDVNGLQSNAVQHVTIVNLPPIAPDVEVSTLMNHEVSADPMESASDPDNVPSKGRAAGLTLTNVSQPSHGTISVGSDGKIQYTPTNGYYGTEIISYTVCDKGNPALCATGKLTIKVLDDNVDLVIKKSTSPNSVDLNEEFEYMIDVSNLGHVSAHDVVVLDPLSVALVYVSSNATNGQVTYDPVSHKVTWNLASLDVNGSASLTLRVKAIKGGNVLNTVEVKGAQPEMDPSSNTAQVIKTVLGFKIPNVFTPNGDVINDTFVIDGIDDLKTQLVVLSRWGNEVYKSDNYRNDWDGSQLHDGTYFYVLTVTASDNKSVRYTGYVTILR